jgi:hypothetical protein
MLAIERVVTLTEGHTLCAAILYMANKLSFLVYKRSNRRTPSVTEQAQSLLQRSTTLRRSKAQISSLNRSRRIRGLCLRQLGLSCPCN